MITQIAQLLTHSSFFKDWNRFNQNANALRLFQEKILEETLSNHPFIRTRLEFKKLKFMDYGTLVKRLAHSNEKIVRHQPTSGSGEKEKLIPYTKKFIRELNRGLNPWLFDICRIHPEILSGTHFWSISWIPTHWRKQGWQLDDFELLPRWKKHLTRTLLAVPHEVSQAKTLQASQFATIAYLVAARDLTFISVWSPTFFIQLLQLLKKWQDPLTETIEKGKWSYFQDELSFLKAPLNPNQARRLKYFQHIDYHEIWPSLKLLSSWDSSTSRPWAEKLRRFFPLGKFQGKGLWATEGVVTIPFKNQFLLSYLSHYYEFLDLKSGNLLPSWELKEGMEVHPILTCANGFTRYHLTDRMRVTGFYQQVPAMEFLERDRSYDLVGEKLDATSFLQLHDQMKKLFPHLQWVSAFAVNDGSHRPFYFFVFQGEENEVLVLKNIKKFLDDHFHYHLAREIGQLEEEKIYISHQAFEQFERFQMERGMVQGNIKVELSCLITKEEEGKLLDEYFTKRA